MVPAVTAATAAPAADPAARRSLRTRLRGGALARAVARADIRLYRLLRDHGHEAVIEQSVRRFSQLGEHAAIWVALGLAGAAADGERRPSWLRATCTVVAAYALNTLLKAIVRRRRPQLDMLPALISTPTALSFPSAHASSSFAAARAFAPLLPAARAPLYAAATGMALSRVYLGVHYPSDIAAGAVLGTLVGGRGAPS